MPNVTAGQDWRGLPRWSIAVKKVRSAGSMQKLADVMQVDDDGTVNLNKHRGIEFRGQLTNGQVQGLGTVRGRR